jgi:hypothetical protein
MRNIDTKKNVRFFDDRGKTKGCVYMDEILYENKSVCLCKVEGDEVLFQKDNGQVLTQNLAFWYAENYTVNAAMDTPDSADRS